MMSFNAAAAHIVILSVFIAAKVIETDTQNTGHINGEDNIVDYCHDVG